MFKVSAVFILSLALAGCAASPSMQAFKSSSEAPRYAWDGAGEDPNQPGTSQARRAAAVKRARSEPAKELELSSVGTGQDRADLDEAARDARLSRALVICRGCLRQQESDERMAGLRN